MIFTMIQWFKRAGIGAVLATGAFGLTGCDAEDPDLSAVDSEALLCSGTERNLLYQ
jgi:hypothetical protein